MSDVFEQSYPPSLWTEEPEGETRSLPGDVAHFTIAQIQEWVDAHESQAQAVLDAEMARGAQARTTLIDWLNGFIEAENNPDGDA